jgi:Zn-dependent metalloprotease
VGPEKGEIITYLSRDRAAPAISAPKISQAQAVETAVKYFTGITALSHTEGLETTARSSVAPSLQNRVVWIVDLHIDLPVGDHRGGQVIVDAETGEVLDFNPCQ